MSTNTIDYKESLKKLHWSIGKALLIAFLIALFLKIFLPLPISTISLIGVFICVTSLETFFLFTEAESATKRTFSRLLKVLMFTGVFIGFRIIFGEVFGAPIFDTYIDINTHGYAGYLMSTSLIGKELIFVGVAVIFAYLFQQEGKQRKLASTIAVLSVIVIVFTSSNPATVKSWGRVLKAFVSVGTERNNEQSVAWEVDAKTAYGKAKQNILAKDLNGHDTDVIIQSGEELFRPKMTFVNGKEYVQHDVECLIPVIRKNQNNGYFEGDTYLVPDRVITKLNTLTAKATEESVAYTFTGIGYTGGVDGKGGVLILTHGINVQSNNRVVVIGKNVETWYGGKYVPTHNNKFDFANKMRKQGGKIGARAPLGESFTVTVKT